MKILHIMNSVDPASGGPIEVVKQLWTTPVSGGHHVEIASLDPPNAPYLNQCPLPVYPLGPATLGYAFSARLVPWLRANRSHFDAAIVNGIWQFHSFGAWRALHASSTPYVLFTHGMLDPWFKKRYPLKHFKKWMYWPWAEYRVLRDARAVLFTTEEERVLARSSFWLYRCNEVVVNYGTARPNGDPEMELREFYSCLINLVGEPAFRDGKFLPLNHANRENADYGRLPGESVSGHWLYAFLRYDPLTAQRFLVVANLHPTLALYEIRIQLSQNALGFLDGSPNTQWKTVDRLSNCVGQITDGQLRIAQMNPLSASYFEFLP